MHTCHQDSTLRPSSEFVKFLTKKVYYGMFTQAVKDEFTGHPPASSAQFVNDRVSGRFESALREEESATVEEAPEPSSDGEIETTAEELEAFYIVRAIMRDVVDVKRIAMRDIKTYCGILLDDNNQPPICRLHFDGPRFYLGLFDEEKSENRVLIDDLDGIYE